jgi:uncharacterized protein
VLVLLQIISMPAVLITGGTGLIGKALTQALVAKGYEVIILSRSRRSSSEKNIRYAYWDINKQEFDTAAITQCDYFVHLAGAGVADKRWSDKRKEEIVHSRTQSSALLVKALSENTNRVQAVISASAIGWYGEDTTESRQQGFTEDMLPANDFLGQTCYAWEKSIEPVTALGKRLVKLRTGIVLTPEGGALKEFMMPAKLCVAAVLGNGQQMVSWIHLDDLCNMYIAAIEQEQYNGSYNAVAPYPVTNKELTLNIARQLRGKIFIPFKVPAFLLKILLGEMSIEVLKSATVSSRKIAAAGFHFKYPSIARALSQLLQ